MKEYVIQNKVKQFIENYQQIKKLKGSWSMGMIQYSCALSLAMRNQDVNIEKIEKDLKDRYKIDVIPALIIDGNIVSKGAVLTDREIKRYIKELCME